MTLLLQDTLVISPATVDKIEQEIEDLRGATDCADVVQDKAALDAYDTSKLTDKAIVKVLQDESRNYAETYYRYSKSSDSFTFIGELGPYYTKSEDDTLLAGKVDKTSTENQVYVTDSSGNQTTARYSIPATASSIVKRTTTGQITVQETPSADTDATSKKYVDDADALKQNKSTIVTSDTTTLSVALADNIIYNNTSTGLTTLDITIPANPTIDFSSEINFTSGSVATVVTGNNIVWLGDNVNENTGFVPRITCRYTIDFTYDGSNIRGYVQGVSL